MVRKHCNYKSRSSSAKGTRQTSLVLSKVAFKMVSHRSKAMTIKQHSLCCQRSKRRAQCMPKAWWRSLRDWKQWGSRWKTQENCFLSCKVVAATSRPTSVHLRVLSLQWPIQSLCANDWDSLVFDFVSKIFQNFVSCGKCFQRMKMNEAVFCRCLNEAAPTCHSGAQYCKGFPFLAQAGQIQSGMKLMQLSVSPCSCNQHLKLIAAGKGQWSHFLGDIFNVLWPSCRLDWLIAIWRYIRPMVYKCFFYDFNRNPG